eukprot:gene5931-biopygen5396
MNHADIVVARWNDTAEGDCIVEDQFNDGDFEGKPARDVDWDCRLGMDGWVGHTEFQRHTELSSGWSLLPPCRREEPEESEEGA